MLNPSTTRRASRFAPLFLLLAACGSNTSSTDASDSGSDAISNDVAASDVTGSDVAGDASGMDATGDASGTDAGPVDGGPTLAEGCDPLVPSHCGYPFPSNTWLVDATDTATGKRVIFGPRAIPYSQGMPVTPGDSLQFSDGFSPGAGPMTHMPGATITGLADPDHIAHSLDADSPTVIIEADTGVRVAHFAELDMSKNDARYRALMMRPTTRLKDHTRYIVAIRHVVDAAGTALPPSPAFLALRDNSPYPGDPSIEARRGLYQDIFAKLSAAGIAQNDLQIAWDFTTASRENNTAGMLQMRDDSLAELPAAGPHYVIDSVMNNVNTNIAVRIEGHVTVPLYLAAPGPGALMTLDAHGMPVRNGTADYPFLVLVPHSATMGTPRPLLQFGHGLFGDRYMAEGDDFETFAEQYGYVIFAMDWLGLSNQDLQPLANIIASGDFRGFRSVPDRGDQAFLNLMYALRMMKGAFVNEPSIQFNGQSAIDPTHVYYFGGSQGGIYGATYMALTQEIERGVLGVPGQAYSLMLPRSIHFDQFALVLDSIYDNALDVQLILGLAQMYWDRAEPDGYSPYIIQNTLPNTPAHRVLVLEAIGDHQVPNLSSQLLARSIGVPQLNPVVRTVFGIPEVDSPYDGSALVEFDFGLPPVPIFNVPMRDGDDPHSAVGHVIPAREMADSFFRTGTAVMTCTGTCNPD